MSRADVGFEFMLNALRLVDGVPAALFAERTGYPLSLVARGLDAATRKGLLEPDPAVVQPTALGRRFLNDVDGAVPGRARPRPHAVGAARADRGDGGGTMTKATPLYALTMTEAAAAIAAGGLTALALADAQLARVADDRRRDRRVGDARRRPRARLRDAPPTTRAAPDRSPASAWA